MIPGASHCQFADANSACNLGELNCKATIAREVQFTRCWQYVNPFLLRSDDFARSIENSQVQTSMTFPSVKEVSLIKSDACAGDTISVRYTGSAKEVLWLPDSVRSSSFTTVVQRGDSPLSLIVTTCFGTTRIDTIVRVIPPPTVEIVGDTLLCPGDSVRLTARTNASGSNPVSIRWSTGETGVSISVRETGVVGLTAISDRGCGTASVTRAVTVVDVPRIYLRLAGDTVLCDGKGALRVSLQGELGNIENIRWSTGDTSTSITLSQPGRYVLAAHMSVRSQLSCPVTTDTVEVDLRSVTPTIPQIRYERDTLWSTPADTYQWSFQGSVLPAAKMIYHVPTRSGSYAVTTTRSDEAGCQSQSAPFAVMLTSIGHEQTMPQHWITGGVLRLAASPGLHVIQLRNLRAETVLQRTFDVDQTGLIAIDVTALPSGVYSVSLDELPVGLIQHSVTSNSR